MAGRFRWSVTDEQGKTQVKLIGAIDEDADLANLGRDLDGKGAVRFEMASIERINSCGVREWVNFIRRFPQRVALEIDNCSPVVVAQLNMIDNFAANAKVLSVQAPFICAECGHEENVRIPLDGRGIPSVSNRTCSKCGGASEFDDIEESYFAFISE